MTENLITHLRHVALAVPDFATQHEFYRTTFGLSEAGKEDGLAYFAAEGSPERYVVRLREAQHAQDKRLDLIAFGAASRGDVDRLAQRLGTAGVRLVSEPDVLQGLGGGYGFRFFDIDGRVVEVSADVDTRRHRPIEEREAIPVRLAHVVVNSPDPARTRDFYAKHLGFRLSDTLHHPHMGDLLYFMRCNSWHHALAIARGPHVSVQHVSFEMRGLEEWLRGQGRAMRLGAEKVWGPGRHAAGDNVFAYFLDPHGNGHEFTYGILEIDEDTWHPTVFDASRPEVTDQWGTADPMDELVVSKLFNTPDPQFLPPPV